MARKANPATPKAAKHRASLNGNHTQAKARKPAVKPAPLEQDTEPVPTREVTLADGTVGRLSLYKAQRGRKHFTKEEREIIANWRAIFAEMDKQEKKEEQVAPPAPSPPPKPDRRKLAHYKARPDKEHYTAEELECIALTTAVLEALEQQEPLYP